jgi:ERCC4-type nuclease
VDIEAEQVAVVGFEEQVAQAVKAVAAIPGITAEQADALVHHGFTSLEDLLQAEQTDLAGIPQIGEQAAAVYDAVRAEAGRRQLKVGQPSQAPVA